MSVASGAVYIEMDLYYLEPGEENVSISSEIWVRSMRLLPSSLSQPLEKILEFALSSQGAVFIPAFSIGHT